MHKEKKCIDTNRLRADLRVHFYHIIACFITVTNLQAEKLLAELQFRYDQLQDSLDEQGGVASQQVCLILVFRVHV